MVHRCIDLVHPTPINAEKYRDTERVFRDRDEVRKFAYLGDCSWHELDLGTTSEFDTPTFKILRSRKKNMMTFGAHGVMWMDTPRTPVRLSKIIFSQEHRTH